MIRIVNTKRSAYMEWAKTRSSARFNLATSGIMNVPLTEFPLRVEDLEITIPKGGYGYEPLLATPRAAHRRADGMHRHGDRHFDGESSRDGGGPCRRAMKF